ncbi:MAG TPA: acyl-ACP desaturase [Nevskiaceae bacterium]
MAAAIGRHMPVDAEQFELLASMEPFVSAEIAAHLARRKLWLPSELLAGADGADPDAEMRDLRQAVRGLPDALRVALAINLLTEEGLPHFHRLIASYMGNESPWNRWNNIWTAEEDRHGCALRDYLRDGRVLDIGALERLQYAYIEAGFNPEWEDDPYRLLAYTSLQERATQMAHANTGRACARYEPRIQRVLAHISGDELRHCMFYRNVFARVLAEDPGRALYALWRVMPALAMPGLTIPGYEEMSEVVRRADIYGPRQYRRCVEELLAFWHIGDLSGLDGDGRHLQAKLMQIPARLERMANHLEKRSVSRAFRFDFLDGRTIAS